jgi:uncharacterized protein
MWPLLAGICMGTLFGVLLLPHDGNGRATVWLGLALAAYAALGLLKGQFPVPRHAKTWLGLLMGTATGAITVVTGTFVMPGTPICRRSHSSATRWCRRSAFRSRHP